MIALVYVVLCAVLAFGCLCRAAAMCRLTARPLVRLSVSVLGFVSSAAGVAPWAWGYTPRADVPGLLMVGLLAGIVLVQLVSAGSWVGGVPSHYQPETCRG